MQGTWRYEPVSLGARRNGVGGGGVENSHAMLDVNWEKTDLNWTVVQRPGQHKLVWEGGVWSGGGGGEKQTRLARRAHFKPQQATSLVCL